MVLDPGEVPMLLAGAVNLGLAGALLYLGFHRPWNRAFALLLAIVGLFRVCFALAAMATDPAARQYWDRMLAHLGLVDEFALLYLAAVFPRRRAWLPRAPWGFVPFFLGMVAVSGAYVAVPGLWAGLDQPILGSRAPLQAFASLVFVAYAVVPLVLVREYARGPPGGDRRAVLLVAVGLATIASHVDGRVLGTAALGAPPPVGPEEALSLLTVLVRVALFAVLGAWLLRIAGREPTAAGAAAVRRYALLLALPLVTGLAVAALFGGAPTGVVPRLVSGSWFAIGGIVLAYAVVRHHEAAGRAPGLQPARGRWSAPLLAAMVFLTLFLVVNAVVLTASEEPFVLSVGILGGLGLGAAGARVVLPAGSWPWGGRGVEDSERRLGPYRVALQAELAAGAEGEALDAKLRPLRAELGVSEQEHAAMEFVLRPSPAGGDRGAWTPGVLFLGRYRVVKPLGQGGGGATHLCRDELVGRDVVIKVIRSPLRTAEGLQQVLREARAIGGIQHPNVLTLLDVQQVGDEVFIVMEHAVGGSLAARLAQGPCAREEFRPLAEGTLRALEAVHAAGVVHRDVKPSNILLTAEGLPKLADFGVAHIRGFETTAGPGDGAASGTVRYMSPEQARGRKAGPQSDLFSAAATLYEAYTGKPFLDALPAESPMELQMRAARGVAFDRPLDGPAPLRAWFARALDPAPERRFPSAKEMREELTVALPGAA